MIVIRLIFVSLLLLVTVSAQLDQTDTQQWTDVQLAVPVATQFDFNLLGTLRFGRDITHAIDERVGARRPQRHRHYAEIQALASSF
jgi:hypothetical protein